MSTLVDALGFNSHSLAKITTGVTAGLNETATLTYTFHNHFHPFVGELLERFNRRSLGGLLDIDFHETLEEHFFHELYRPLGAEVEIWTSAQGIPKFLEAHPRQRATWHSVVAGNFSGESGSLELMFYDARQGEIEFYVTNEQGHFTLLNETPRGCRTTWHSVVAGRFTNSNFHGLLFYDAQKGEVEVYTTDGEGNLTLVAETHTGWRTTWHSVRVGNFSGSPFDDLIFYDAQNGEVEVYTTDGKGHLTLLGETLTGWRKTWHSISTGHFSQSPSDDLVFYDAQNGEVEVYATNLQGNLTLLGQTLTGWRQTWHSTSVGNFSASQFDDLLFYDAQNGEAEVYASDQQGKLTLVGQTLTGWRKTWHSVVTIASKRLVFYDASEENRYYPKNIDVSENGSYSVYNWELLFHAPLTIAVHLSKNQRFVEAQRWFHYIFDPTSNDTGVDAPKRFWRFLRFRQDIDITQIDELLAVLSKPADECTLEELELKENILNGYDQSREQPFQPHVVARTRHLAYQYCVVMKYLENLIAWGDSLFRQDTIETINEATQLYVLAANLLGPKPQRVPARGTIRPKTFAQLRANGLDPLGNALVELEGQFPFNLHTPTTRGVDTDKTNLLFGIGRALYFCVPRNEKLLSYWDVVADRLFKIRHCMSIEGVARQLPLFEPPIDPGMLVKAAAAGVDISSLVSGLNQPLAPVRSALLIQKALELCNEVRGMGANLLAALEKRDAEAVALLRQRHEISIQQMVQDVRYLQWKEAEETTASLVKSRESAVERYRFYQRVLGRHEEDLKGQTDVTLERPELTEENFEQIYGQLVGRYAHDIQREEYPLLKVIDKGRLYLSRNEDVELNKHLPQARDKGLTASVLETIASSAAFVPDGKIDLHYWGLGGTIDVPIGSGIRTLSEIGARILHAAAAWERDQAGLASRTASYERRADEWMFQSNLAARDLMQIGRQIISSLIREQITRHEYENLKRQIKQAEEIDRFLREKFTSTELYVWMQGELCKLYYECYKFAFDIARKAEQTMKHELMRPELDAMSFIKFNYWDGGRKGLLSGEGLYLDLKRLEMAYHDHNKREYELTKHVSLRQLDPGALLTLKATGSCEFTLPEWLFDLDGPGHYMRRLKNVSLSIPAVAGPFTGINCTLSLLKSSLRRSPLLRDDEYERDEVEDTRFVDYYGTIQSIVTSNAQNDSGMFEPNLRDERFLPFEGAGAESSWRLELPSELRQFDYDSIPDVILHLRLTARPGGDQLRRKAVESLKGLLNHVGTFAQMFSLRHDFPSEWQRFVGGHDKFNVTLRKEFFPYLVQSANVTVDSIVLRAIKDSKLEEKIVVEPTEDGVLLEPGGLELTIEEDKVLVRNGKAQMFLLVSYRVSFVVSDTDNP